jgi:hypothetical protein
MDGESTIRETILSEYVGAGRLFTSAIFKPSPQKCERIQGEIQQGSNTYKYSSRMSKSETVSRSGGSA